MKRNKKPLSEKEIKDFLIYTKDKDVPNDLIGVVVKNLPDPTGHFMDPYCSLMKNTINIAKVFMLWEKQDKNNDYTSFSWFSVKTSVFISDDDGWLGNDQKSKYELYRMILETMKKVHKEIEGDKQKGA